MTYLLVVTTSILPFIPGDQSIQEFSSLSSCEAALRIAKERYATVNDKSYCASVEDLSKKVELERAIDEATAKLRGMK